MRNPSRQPGYWDLSRNAKNELHRKWVLWLEAEKLKGMSSEGEDAVFADGGGESDRGTSLQKEKATKEMKEKKKKKKTKNYKSSTSTTSHFGSPRPAIPSSTISSARAKQSLSASPLLPPGSSMKQKQHRMIPEKVATTSFPLSPFSTAHKAKSLADFQQHCYFPAQLRLQEVRKSNVDARPGGKRDEAASAGSDDGEWVDGGSSEEEEEEGEEEQEEQEGRNSAWSSDDAHDVAFEL